MLDNTMTYGMHVPSHVTGVSSLLTWTEWPSHACVVTLQRMTVTPSWRHMMYTCVCVYIRQKEVPCYNTITRSLPTLWSLLSLSQRCPELSELTLLLSFLELPPLEQVPVTYHKSIDLDVNYIELGVAPGTERHIAGILKCVFPCTALCGIGRVSVEDRERLSLIHTHLQDI